MTELAGVLTIAGQVQTAAVGALVAPDFPGRTAV